MSVAWKVVAASVAGSAHLREGQGCQDSCAVDRIEVRGEAEQARAVVQIVAVADGAGSVPCGQDGARAATAAAMTELRLGLEAASGDWRQVAPPALRAAAGAARESVGRLAGAAQRPVGDYASTLILLAIGSNGVFGIHIGDGAVVAAVNAEADSLEVLSAPEKGAFVNETTFLTGAEYMSRAREFAVSDRPLNAIAAFTDGIERLALTWPSVEPFPPFFWPLFKFASDGQGDATAAAELASFLTSERVCAKTDDDKTLVIVIPGDRDAAAQLA